jgi:hypothetical protein
MHRKTTHKAWTKHIDNRRIRAMLKRQLKSGRFGNAYTCNYGESRKTRTAVRHAGDID